MDELVMTISASERETRVLLMRGPGEVMKARLQAAMTPAHRFAGSMLCESMAPWHDRGARAVVSAESEHVLFALGLCDGLGVARATAHYLVQHFDDPPRRGQRLSGLGNFRAEHRGRAHVCWCALKLISQGSRRPAVVRSRESRWSVSSVVFPIAVTIAPPDRELRLHRSSLRQAPLAERDPRCRSA